MSKHNTRARCCLPLASYFLIGGEWWRRTGGGNSTTISSFLHPQHFRALRHRLSCNQRWFKGIYSSLFEDCRALLLYFVQLFAWQMTFWVILYSISIPHSSLSKAFLKIFFGVLNETTLAWHLIYEISLQQLHYRDIMSWWSLVVPTNTPLSFVYSITSLLFLCQVVVTAIMTWISTQP